MKYLPPPVEVPSFIKYLGFQQIPSGPEEIKERYRTLSKQMHPDTGGNPEDFQKLKEVAEKAMQYFNEVI